MATSARKALTRNRTDSNTLRFACTSTPKILTNMFDDFLLSNPSSRVISNGNVIDKSSFIAVRYNKGHSANPATPFKGSRTILVDIPVGSSGNRSRVSSPDTTANRIATTGSKPSTRNPSGSKNPEEVNPMRHYTCMLSFWSHGGMCLECSA